MRWTRQCQALLRKTTGTDADGQAVWSWRPDAGAKLAMMLPHHADDGGKQARLTGESAKETVKTTAQGRPGRSG